VLVQKSRGWPSQSVHLFPNIGATGAFVERLFVEHEEDVSL
jgi:hypothetical protein